jgi:hypothetical protein
VDLDFVLGIHAFDGKEQITMTKESFEPHLDKVTWFKAEVHADSFLECSDCHALS